MALHSAPPTPDSLESTSYGDAILGISPKIDKNVGNLVKHGLSTRAGRVPESFSQSHTSNRLDEVVGTGRGKCVPSGHELSDDRSPRMVQTTGTTSRDTVEWSGEAS